jgi:hypothetical protein
VYVEKTRVGATNWSYVKRSGIEWGRSGRIHVVFVNRCPSRYYCVKVYEVRSTPQPRRLGHPQLRPQDQYRLVRQPAPQHPLPDLRRRPAQDHLPRARPHLRPGAPPDRPDLHARRLHHHAWPPRRHRLRQPAPDLRQALTGAAGVLAVYRCTSGQVRVRVTPLMAWMRDTTSWPRASMLGASARTMTSYGPVRSEP